MPAVWEGKVDRRADSVADRFLRRIAGEAHMVAQQRVEIHSVPTSGMEHDACNRHDLPLAGSEISSPVSIKSRRPSLLSAS